MFLLVHLQLVALHAHSVLFLFHLVVYCALHLLPRNQGDQVLALLVGDVLAVKLLDASRK
jgi:hypothetical protein